MRPKTGRLVAAVSVLVVGLGVWFLLPGLDAAPPFRLTETTTPSRSPGIAPDGIPRQVTPTVAPATAPGVSPGSVRGRLIRGSPPVPLPGIVTVAVDARDTRRCETDAGGRFRMDNLPRGSALELVATSGSLPPARFPSLAIPFDRGLDLGDISLGPLETVDVRVRDFTDTPVSGASVSLSRIVRNAAEPTDTYATREHAVLAPPPGATVMSQSTDAWGRVRLDAVPPGHWLVVVNANGLISDFRTVTVSEGTIRDPLLFRLTAGHELVGRLHYEDGSPAGGLELQLLGDFETDLPARARSDAGGGFRFRGLDRATFDLWVERAQGAWKLLASPRVPMTGPLELTVPAVALLGGSVVDAATGEPLAGVEILAIGDVKSIRSWWSSGARARATSDLSGEFHVPWSAREGSLTLLAGREGYLPGSVTIRNPGLESVPEIRLEKGGVIRGRVLRTDGSAVSGALVWARPLHPGTPGFRREEIGEETPRVRSDILGNYEIPAAGPGSVLVVAIADGLLLPDVPLGLADGYHPDRIPESLKVLVPSGGEVVRDLIMVPGASVAGVVVDREGEPVAGLSVSIESAPRLDGHENSMRLPSGEGISGPTASDGSFRVNGLLPGTRRFAVASGAGRREGASEEFDLEGGSAVTGLVIRVVRNSGSVSGSVRFEDDSPAAGSEVRFLPWPWFGSRPGREPEYRTVVRADGSFMVEDLPSGAYRPVVAFGDTPGFSCSQIQVEAGTTLEGVVLTVPRGLPVSGRVLDAEGKPVCGAGVLVEPVDAGDGDEPPESYLWSSSPGGNGPRIPVVSRATCTTDDRGAFRQAGLPPGDCWVSAGAAGHLEDWKRVPAGSEEVELHLADPLEIRGVILDDATGLPAPGVPIYCHAFSGTRIPEELGWLHSGEDGSFVVSPLVPGNYHLNFASHLIEADHPYFEKDVKSVAAGTVDLVVRLASGIHLSGRVVDREGRAVPDVSLRLFDAEASGLDAFDMQFGMPLAECNSGPDGSFRFGGLKEVPYRIGIGGDRFGRSGRGDIGIVKTLSDALRPEASPHTLHAIRGDPIRGRVLGPDGEPAMGRVRGSRGQLRLYSTAGARFIDWIRLEEDGSFVTDALDPGATYNLVASDFGFALGAELCNVTPGSDVVLRLASGRAITGRIRDESGMPAPPGVRVRITMVDGDADPFGESERSTETREDGRFAFVGLPEGTYRVSAGGRNSDFPEASMVDPVSGGSMDVSFVLHRGASVSGRVLDAGGKPVFHPQIRVAGGVYEFGVGSEDGSFRLNGLKPGPVRLLGYHPRTGQEVELGTFEAPVSGLEIRFPVDSNSPAVGEDR